MGLDLERLRLMVFFGEDCKVSYPLELGAYSIGSNKACTIRLEGAGVEDVHAILFIEPGNVRIHHTSSTLLYETGQPVRDGDHLSPGDTVILDPYRLSLIEMTPPRDTATRDLSPEAHGQVEGLWNQLRRGLPGYDDVLAKLASFISPEEAKAARDATGASLRALGFTLFLLALLMVGAAVLPAQRPNLAAVSYDLGNAGFLLGSLILISRFQIHFAGRVMMPLSWILTFLTEPPASDWYELSHVFDALGGLLVAVMIGALVDFGASPEPQREQLLSQPGRGRRILRRLSLLLIGALTIYDAVDRSEHLQGWALVFSFISGVACMAWSWWPGPALERTLHRKPFDVQVLKLIGIRRWARYAGGRLLAACLGILPALLFLYSFGIDERMKWPETDDPKLAIQTPGKEPGKPKVWFWKQTGHFLKSADLRKFYGFRYEEVEKDRLREIGSLAEELASDPHDEAAYARIKRELRPYPLSSSDQMKAILAASDSHPERADQQESIYYLQANQPSYEGLFGAGRQSRIFSARDQLSFGWSQFVEYTAEDIKSREASSGLRRLILMICGFIGLLILWRRGGDWSYALWLGLWFVGVATAGTYRYSLFFFPRYNHEIWDYALTYSGFNVTLNVLHLLDALVLANIIAFSTFLSCAVIWSWVCWPTRASYWRESVKSPMLGSFVHVLVVVLKVIAVTLAMNLLFLGSRIGLSALLQRWSSLGDLASALAGLVFVAVTFGVGYKMVGYKMKVRGGNRLSRLSWVSGLLFVSTQILAMLSVSESPGLSFPWKTLKWVDHPLVYARILVFLILIALCAVLFVFLLLVVRKNFLRLFTLRDASVAMTAFVALVAHALMHDWMHSGIERVSDLSETGSSALSLLAFVVLAPSTNRYIERILLRLSLAKLDLRPRFSISLRRLRTIERKIGTALELLLDTQDPRKIANIRRALATCGIKEYVFFARKGKRSFMSSVNCGSPVAPDQIVISKMLLKFLAKRTRVIDLEQLAFEWDLFFLQFELQRLRQERPARYLIPIKLGESLRGLLFVSNTADQRALAGERVTEGIADLALLTTQLRYQHSSNP
jgi:hypothetical protein